MPDDDAMPCIRRARHELNGEAPLTESERHRRSQLVDRARTSGIAVAMLEKNGGPKVADDKDGHVAPYQL